MRDLFCLKPKVNEDSSKILIVFFNAVIQLFDMSLV